VLIIQNQSQLLQACGLLLLVPLRTKKWCTLWLLLVLTILFNNDLLWIELQWELLVDLFVIVSIYDVFIWFTFIRFASHNRRNLIQPMWRVHNWLAQLMLKLSCSQNLIQLVIICWILCQQLLHSCVVILREESSLESFVFDLSWVFEMFREQI